MNILVGYTGFVGSNIYANGVFDAVYNSKNIGEAYGTKPDLLIYAGLRAEKYLANHAPEKDWQLIREAEENIAQIAPRKLVLISTIDVFQNPRNVNEESVVETDSGMAYGYHRYQLELWGRKHFADALIIRLPGLFGKNLKKNFLYDYINIIPYMLRESKLEELSERDAELKQYYQNQGDGFYKVKDLDENVRKRLQQKCQSLGFTALDFTDSRSVYQFYPLNRLWSDIHIALEHDLRIWHPATEPLSAGEIYHFLSGENFVNELTGTPAYYDYRTRYAEIFGGRDGYICDKKAVLKEIKEFVENERNGRQDTH